MKAILTAQGLLTGSGNDPASDLSGEAALTWYDWNEGAGSYTSTSPYRYRGGRYPNTGGGATQRGRDIRALLETAYNADPTTFLAPLTVLRRSEVTDIANPETSTAGATSTVLIWNTTSYVGVTPPVSASIMIPIDMYYNSGTARYTGAQAATQLAAQPAGRRCLRVANQGASGFTSFFAIPVNSSATNNRWRGAMHDRDYDTYDRAGLSMADWQADMLDGSSTWRTFWEDLHSNGGDSIIDYLILDVGEVRISRFFRLGSPTLLESALNVDGTSRTLTVSGIDTGTDVFTSDTHNTETGTPVHIRTAAGGFATSPSLTVLTTIAYLRSASGTTFTLHSTRAGALANTSKIDVTNAGSGVTIAVRREDFSNIFADSDWSTFRTTRLLPVLSQATWDGYAAWDIGSDERVMLTDAALMAYFSDMCEPVLQIPLDEFPNLKISDYNVGLNCAATRSTYSAAALGHIPYGGGTRIGNVSSHSNYMQYDRNVWKWSSLANVQQILSNPSAEIAWATLVQNVASLRSLAGASTSDMEAWTTPTQGGASGLNIPEDDPLVSEFILHNILPSSMIGFYNSNLVDGIPTVAQQTLALNLIAERDTVVGYSPATIDPQLDLAADYSIDVITTRVWAGGRWVWRVTPRPGATTTIEQDSDGVRFTCDGVTLSIGNGRIVTLPVSYASLGYWVVESVSSSAPSSSDPSAQISYRRNSTTEVVYARS